MVGKEEFVTELETSIAKQVAEAAAICHLERTGQAPESVAVVLSGDTLVVTLHGALSRAERELARSEEGAAKVQEFHKRLLASAMEPMRTQIKKIVGAEVREGSSAIEPGSGTVMQAFTTGTMVQVFLLDGKVAAGAWSGAATARA